MAVIVEWRGRVALLRRRGRYEELGGTWDCVTGRLDVSASAEQQVLMAIFAATGIKARAIDSLDDLGVLDAAEGRAGSVRMRVFRATTRQRRLVLGQGHDANRWVPTASVTRFGNRTPWLDDVLVHLASSSGMEGR